MLKTLRHFILLTIFILASFHCAADEIKIASASNFVPVLKKLVTAFTANSRHKIIIIPGSSGKHYAQIKHGAPYDAFFSADSLRPALLEQENLAVNGSRFTYAIGQLVLWSPESSIQIDEAQTLTDGEFKKLAIANPKLAPYGHAAQQTLEKLNLWSSYKNRLIRGENIAQTFHFLQSGHVPLGLVAYSQILQHNNKTDSYWLIPQSYYDPIEQQAVLLNDQPLAQDFMTYCQSEEARSIIQQSGYLTR